MNALDVPIRGEVQSWGYNTIEILQKIELYDIDHLPIMPNFDIPAEFGKDAELTYKDQITMDMIPFADEFRVSFGDLLNDKKAMIGLKIMVANGRFTYDKRPYLDWFQPFAEKHFITIDNDVCKIGEKIANFEPVADAVKDGFAIINQNFDAAFNDISALQRRILALESRANLQKNVILLTLCVGGMYILRKKQAKNEEKS